MRFDSTSMNEMFTNVFYSGFQRLQERIYKPVLRDRATKDFLLQYADLIEVSDPDIQAEFKRFGIKYEPEKHNIPPDTSFHIDITLMEFVGWYKIWGPSGGETPRYLLGKLFEMGAYMCMVIVMVTIGVTTRIGKMEKAYGADTHFMINNTKRNIEDKSTLATTVTKLDYIIAYLQSKAWVLIWLVEVVFFMYYRNVTNSLNDVMVILLMVGVSMTLYHHVLGKEWRRVGTIMMRNNNTTKDGFCHGATISGTPEGITRIVIAMSVVLAQILVMSIHGITILAFIKMTITSMAVIRFVMTTEENFQMEFLLVIGCTFQCITPIVISVACFWQKQNPDMWRSIEADYILYKMPRENDLPGVPLE